MKEILTNEIQMKQLRMTTRVKEAQFLLQRISRHRRKEDMALPWLEREFQADGKLNFEDTVVADISANGQENAAENSKARSITGRDRWSGRIRERSTTNPTSPPSASGKIGNSPSRTRPVSLLTNQLGRGLRFRRDSRFSQYHVPACCRQRQS
jgi:hypothetical protein